MCDAHHIDYWVDGGPTNTDNLLLLCRRHHRYLHEYGFRLEVDDGAARFFDPYDRLIPTTGTLPIPRIGILDRMRARHLAEGIRINPATASPRWNGKRPDYDRIVSPLLQ